MLSALVLAAAGVVCVLFGFGAGLISVGLLALVLPAIQDAVVLLLLVNLPAEALVVLSSRKQISWRGVAIICAGIAAGIPLGTLILRTGNPLFLLTLLGGLLVLAGLLFLCLPREGGVRWPTWVAPCTGLVSGVLSGLFGTGGPPLILYFRLAGLAKAAFRGNLMAIFLVVTLVRLPIYALAGLITMPRLCSAAMVLPTTMLGALAGHRIHITMQERTFQLLVAVALALMGGLLLVRSF